MRKLRVMLLVAIVGVLIPGIVSAQSQFTGLVTDESGGALPGVTVEVASPALIEKIRTAVTDGSGRYTIVDLRPGTYKLTFSLAGFSTAVRDAVELTANFSAAINVEMKVGSLEESITVSGETPVVDVQQAARTVVLGRDLYDALPTTRAVQSIGQMIPGIRLSAPDVGGERVLEAPAMRSRGMGGTSQTMYVDGLNVTSSDGGQLPYSNDQLEAEVVVRSSAMPAEVSSAGVSISSISRDGGNIFSGSAFLGGFTNSWQSNNLTPALIARGLDRANAMAHIRVFSAAIGGPVKRNKVWFFFVARHADADEIIADVPRSVTLTAAQLNRPFADWCTGGKCFPPGFQVGFEERTQKASYKRDMMLRLSTQLTPRHKLAALFERGWKDIDSEYSYGTDPIFSSGIQDARDGSYPWGYVKWTSTVSNRILFEAGFSGSAYNQSSDQKPYVDLPRYSANGQVNPAWIANARRTDNELNKNPLCTLPDGCLEWRTGNQNNQNANQRTHLTTAFSYVTGSHSLKAGIQHAFGREWARTDRQADLTQQYNNGVPQSVSVTSTPMYVEKFLNRDSAFYVQDTWTLRRLTLNAGVRVEYFNAQMNEINLPPGRFVPARHFAEEKNLPNWKNDVAPRFSVGYDVFGTGRTALKFAVNKYYASDRTRFASLYAQAAAVSETRNWFDVDLIPGTSTRSGVPRPTDRDDIAQDNEIGPSATTNFGTRAARFFDPDIQRGGNQEVTAGLNHELMRNFALGLYYYHRSFQGIVSNDRVHITNADYSSFQVQMPSFANDPTLAGLLDPNETLTIYNLNPAKRTVFGEIRDRNGDNTSIYNGFETSFALRLPGGTNVYGGWTIERTVSNYCDNNDNPNGGTGTTEYGKSISIGGRFCDQSQFDIPFQSDFKVAGNVAAPFGLSVGAVFQNYPGSERTITWSPPASVFPGGRTNSETIILSTPGSIYQDRYNQVDFNVRKNFRHGNKVFTAQFDLFNATNSSSILGTTNSIGGSLGRINTILKGRMPRIAFQFKF